MFIRCAEEGYQLNPLSENIFVTILTTVAITASGVWFVSRTFPTKTYLDNELKEIKSDMKESLDRFVDILKNWTDESKVVTDRLDENYRQNKDIKHILEGFKKDRE